MVTIALPDIGSYNLQHQGLDIIVRYPLDVTISDLEQDGSKLD